MAEYEIKVTFNDGEKWITSQKAKSKEDAINNFIGKIFVNAYWNEKEQCFKEYRHKAIKAEIIGRCG